MKRDQGANKCGKEGKKTVGFGEKNIKRTVTGLSAKRA